MELKVVFQLLSHLVCILKIVSGDFPFRNTSLPWNDRVTDLIGRLTLLDVVYQMAKGGAGIHGGPAPAIPRLGIKPWSWNTECLRGDANAGEATGFPQAIGLAAAFKDVDLPWNDRVDDLINRLNLTQLMYQLALGGAGPRGGPAPKIPELNIGPYSWNTECLRGDAQAGEATAFPQSIGLAAAFSPTLMHAIAEATGKEVRAKYNDFVKKGQYGDHKGISCFSPVINIMRHPLWGRNQETYGEDPFVNGVYATNYVQGLQGTDNRYIMANAGCKHFDAYAGPENIPTSRVSFDAKETYGEDPYLSGQYADQYVRGLQGNHIRYVQANGGCKHFDVHGGPENIPVSRFSFDSKVPERDWRLTFLPAFRACVKAGTYSIMCSYNRINGVPACASKKLLTDILRREWMFDGYVISDEEAVENIVLYHHYVNTSMEATIAVLEAGLNLELTTSRKDPYFFTIEKAVKERKLSEALVRERARPLFYTRMRLGEFDPPMMNPYSYYNLSMVQSPEHRALAVKAAMQTFVLLKNNELLPLAKKFSKIAIVGPMANNTSQLYGDYAADVDSKFVKTPLDGLKSMADTVRYAPGCKDNKCVVYSGSEVKKAVQGAQLVVICVGTGQELESEGNDRASMDLAGNQTQLIKDAISASGGQSPILLLIFSAGPVNISFADRHPHVQAIIQCFFPAQATGEALYNVITMATEDASPAGRLPYTWYDTADQIPSMTNYSMEGRTYRYFKGKPLYPFGYGLSYSKFQYETLTVIQTIEAGDDQYLYGELMNVGDVDAYEVVQVYISWLTTKELMPQLQLVGFTRVFIKKANSVAYNFVIKPEQLAVWKDNKGWVIEPGKIQLYVGGQQPNRSRTVGSNVLSTSFQITGTKYLGKY